MDLFYKWLSEKAENLVELLREWSISANVSTTTDTLKIRSASHGANSFVSAIIMSFPEDFFTLRKEPTRRLQCDYSVQDLLNENNVLLMSSEKSARECISGTSRKMSTPLGNRNNQNLKLEISNAVHHKHGRWSDFRIPSGESEQNEEESVQHQENPKLKERRKRIPNKPNKSINLWNLLKHFLGQDLSRIPLPVNFFEPLSMLQRISEDFEYSNLLDEAANCKDSYEQLTYLAAFVVTSYSYTDVRLTKPFNPLLAETFEFDRTEDLGWRLICEQVSHHPPISVLYCESKQWKFLHRWEGSMNFTGNSIVMTPSGGLEIEFLTNGNKYKWMKAKTTVRNLIIGNMYLDHSGEVTITNEIKASAEVCYLRFFPYSTFSSGNYRKIQGEVVDEKNMIKWLITGYWDNKIDVVQIFEDKPWEGEKSHVIMHELPTKTIWTRPVLKPESKDYYNFSTFACELNQEEPGVAPTDSRLRPDQRSMELGLWDEANEEKRILEQKQREKRKQSESDVNNPAWFNIKKQGDEVIYEYGGEYWECKEKQDWSRCPSIY